MQYPGTLLVAALACLLSGVSAAHADGSDPEPSATGSASSDSLVVEAVKKAESSEGHAGVSSDGTPAHKPVFSAGLQSCLGAEQVVAADGAPTGITFCPSADPAPALTIGAIRRAFAELPLPAGELVIQPPDGLTLVNFDTNFYTTSTEPIASTVTLLGQQVTLEATPAEYQWDFGDGESLATTEPGAAYPALRITHNYLSTGTYRPSLDTTYTGRYRVGGGPWHQIPGTVTIDGSGQALRAIEAQPKLVGY